MRGLLFREQEAGYLVGYLSGLMEKARKGADVIGSVGGQKIPPVDRYIAGYKAGAKAADKGIKVLNAYSQSFTDLAACKEIALNQIGAGSHVEFQVAGGCGLGTLSAAAQHKIWGIGVDKDQYRDAKRVLTSGVKRVDLGVFNVIKATKLLGPNETDTVTFTAPQVPGQYLYVCSFPGHYTQGTKGFMTVK